MAGVLLITDTKPEGDDFHPKLIFNTLTDEHVLRLLMLQNIKISQSIDDYIQIYFRNLSIDDMPLHPKLSHILKYQADDYQIKLLDYNDIVDYTNIREYSNKISLKYNI